MAEDVGVVRLPHHVTMVTPPLATSSLSLVISSSKASIEKLLDVDAGEEARSIRDCGQKGCGLPSTGDEVRGIEMLKCYSHMIKHWSHDTCTGHMTQTPYLSMS